MKGGHVVWTTSWSRRLELTVSAVPLSPFGPPHCLPHPSHAFNFSPCHNLPCRVIRLTAPTALDGGMVMMGHPL